MAMKYKYLSRALKQDGKWGQGFKWEWAAVCEYQTRHNGLIVPSRTLATSRLAARKFKREMEKDARCSNVRLQRRLVAVDWQPYSDTFTYSAKGCGNGR